MKQLGDHSRNHANGRICKERADSKLINLAEDYPILAQFNGNMHFGVLKKLGVDSLSHVLKTLRNKRGKEFNKG